MFYKFENGRRINVPRHKLFDKTLMGDTVERRPSYKKGYVMPEIFAEKLPPKIRGNLGNKYIYRPKSFRKAKFMH